MRRKKVNEIESIISSYPSLIKMTLRLPTVSSNPIKKMSFPLGSLNTAKSTVYPRPSPKDQDFLSIKNSLAPITNLFGWTFGLVTRPSKC